jgi:hypothetical protein
MGKSIQKKTQFSFLYREEFLRTWELSFPLILFRSFSRFFNDTCVSRASLGPERYGCYGHLHVKRAAWVRDGGGEEVVKLEFHVVGGVGREEVCKGLLCAYLVGS